MLVHIIISTERFTRNLHCNLVIYEKELLNMVSFLKLATHKIDGDIQVITLICTDNTAFLLITLKHLQKITGDNKVQ